MNQMTEGISKLWGYFKEPTPMPRLTLWTEDLIGKIWTAIFLLFALRIADVIDATTKL